MKVKATVTENQRFSAPMGASKDKLEYKTEFRLGLSLTLDNKYNAGDLPVGKEIEIDLPTPAVDVPTPTPTPEKPAEVSSTPETSTSQTTTTTTS